MARRPITTETSGKRLILVADDEPKNRELLCEVLRADYDVVCLEDGRQVVEKARELADRLSLILLDPHMRVHSGHDALRAIRDDPELSRIPVIVVTHDLEAEAESLHLGASDYINKPYPPAVAVLSRVNRTIELAEGRALISSAERDPLTGLYNRDFFYRYAANLDETCAEAEMDAVVIDVRRFHMINERYGRAYANGILRWLGDRLREATERYGGIACRREADTFLAYWPHRADYPAIFEFLSSTLRARESAEKRIHLRMGVYGRVDRNIDIERRFDRAQSASDKLRGNYVNSIGYYDDALHEQELYAEQLIEEFPAALRERQFQVYFQPKFDIRPHTPMLAGAEALVRWNHPERGMISPGIFIPLFESNGLVRELDRYVWRETAAQMRDWKRRLGFTVPVSVNVSRVDINDPQLIDFIQALLLEFGLEPSDFHLEITETAYTQDAKNIIEIIERLRRLGFRIEMDDFGSGYSSLNMISRLPIDVLKLDMQFIRNAFREGRDTRLIEVIIEIAEYLSVPVVAEGVETREQLYALKAMGCHLVQGYYFSKPVQASEFERFLVEWRDLDETLVTEIARPRESAVRHDFVRLPLAEENVVPAIEWLGEQIPGGFFIYRDDNTQKLLYANSEMLRIFGCATREEFQALTGDTFYGLVHPDDYAAIQSSIEGQIGHPENIEELDYVEYRIIRKDGSVRWVDDYGHLTELPGYGKVFFVFIGDITEKRRARELGHRQENLYRRMTEKQSAMADRSLTVLRGDLDTGVVGYVSGTDLLAMDYIGVSMQECFMARAASFISDGERATFQKLFDIDTLRDGYERGDDPVVFVGTCRRSGQVRRIRFTADVLFEPVSGDRVLFISETECDK